MDNPRGVGAFYGPVTATVPRVKVAWNDIWIGAAATAFLFTVGKFAIGFYLGKAGVSSGFGAAGSVVVLLVWVYYSAQIFLLGAEFTWVYAHDHGSRVGEPAPARAPAVPSQAGEAARAPLAYPPSPQDARPSRRPWGDAFVTTAIALVWGVMRIWQQRRIFARVRDPASPRRSRQAQHA